MIMLLSKVSKLLEEGRLRQGVVLVNYRLIVNLMMLMMKMILMVLMMEMMLIMLAFCETSHTRVIVTENISGRRL